MDFSENWRGIRHGLYRIVSFVIEMVHKHRYSACVILIFAPMSRAETIHPNEMQWNSNDILEATLQIFKFCWISKWIVIKRDLLEKNREYLVSLMTQDIQTSVGITWDCGVWLPSSCIYSTPLFCHLCWPWGSGPSSSFSLIPTLIET